MLQLWEFSTLATGMHCQGINCTTSGVNGDSGSTKKLAKVKAAPKAPTKGQSGDPPKGKSAATSESKPQETTNVANGGAGDEGRGGDSTTTEPMGEPSTEAAAELMRDAAGLLKSIRSLKAVRIKSVGEGQFGVPGEVALLDGGATHGLRQARPDEEGELTPTTVHLACGTVVLYRHPKHQTLLSREPIEPIIPLSWLAAADYKITWRRDRCTIHHDTRGALQCHMRGGCPVMDRDAGLARLGDLEKMQRPGPTDLDEAQLSWWASRFPNVPPEVWRYMNGQGRSWKEVQGTLPWNRHQRKRLWRAKGIVIHLFSGRNTKQWAGLVTKCPRRVLQLAARVLAYVQETVDYALEYGTCGADPRDRRAALANVTMLSDASHAPHKVYEDIKGFWLCGEGHWFSGSQRSNPCAALSNTQSELIGYVDAVTMGESFQVVINILENNRPVSEGDSLLKGDNLPGTQLLMSPDGP